MKTKTIFIFLLINISMFARGFSQHTHAEWAKHIIGSEGSSFNNILFSDEAIIANGYWTLEAGFDGIELPYHIGSNGLIVKKDLEGNTIWHATMTGDGWNQFFDINIDSENNIVAAGWSTSNEYIEINGEIVYEPEMEWTTGGVVAKFSGIDGSLIWFKVINPEDEYYNLIVNRIAVDADDNIYIAGYSNSSFEIEGIEFPYTQEGWGSITFLVKFDSDGSIVWGEQFHFVAEGNPGWSIPRSIEINNDDIFFAFQYSKPVIVGDDILPFEGNGDFDWIGLVKLSTQDGQVTKTNAYGSSSEQNIASLKFDNNGNILIAGFFSSGSDFNINGVSPMSYGLEDGYVAKLNNEFELMWLKSMGSEYSSRCFNLSVSYDNRIFVGGGFDSYTPLYFEGHKLINEESPTNSLAMFQIVLDEDGEFEKAFALHGEDISSIVEYKDAVVLDDDIVMVVGQSVDYVNFVEGNQFYSDHWAGFYMKWDLSKEFYKIFFDVMDEEGNALENAIVTLEGTINPFNKHSFYQIDPGTYAYSVTLEGYEAADGYAEVIDQDILVPVILTSTTTSISSQNSHSISLFPNPTSSAFSIISDVDIEYVIISDLTGRLVHKQLAETSSIQLSIQELPSGLYLVRIVTEKGMTIKKLHVIQ